MKIMSVILLFISSVNFLYAQDVLEQHKTIYLAPIRYPTEALRAGITAKLIVNFKINENGKAFDIAFTSMQMNQVSKPIGKKFIDSVIYSLNNSNFSPRKINGKPTVSEVKDFAVDFDLNRPGPVVIIP